ncbi:prepilin peptidase [Aquariibacter albus]|uniref:Prepilin peptidase n=1 Tax=Aquariibacter albus TaxID=2759899 RepID=A0A839HMF0_9BURK|nr:prepilin peptidase [Aquariibacter albus]MBB1160429.1 prepilin peptidase [Aquariibacter albus]
MPDSATVSHLLTTGLAFWMFGGLAVMSLLVAWSDHRSQRIPNDWLLAGLLYACGVIVMHAAPGGLLLVAKALGFGLLGMLIGFVLTAPAMLLRQLAPGDVKFMMVIGFFLGPIGAVFALLNAALFGGLWALALAWRAGGLAKVLGNLRFMARSLWLSGFRTLGWDLGSQGALRMPYGVALAAGTLMVIVWQLGRQPAVRGALGLA